MENTGLTFDGLLEAVSSVGMCVLITIYFLVRDWKFQGAIIEALGKLTAVTDNINKTIERLHGGD